MRGAKSYYYSNSNIVFNAFLPVSVEFLSIRTRLGVATPLVSRFSWAEFCIRKNWAIVLTVFLQVCIQ
jgi:hypothetical protein